LPGGGKIDAGNTGAESAWIDTNKHNAGFFIGIKPGKKFAYCLLYLRLGMGIERVNSIRQFFRRAEFPEE
jgi:hypothetical protein